MMIFTCECGKRFQARGEYAGKRAKCPACKREFLFPVPSAVAPEKPAVPPLLPTIRTDEEKPTQPESLEFRMPWRKAPIIVIGAAVPSLILGAFVGYLAHGPSVDYRSVLLTFQNANLHDYLNPKEDTIETRLYYEELADSMPEGKEGMSLLSNVTGYFRQLDRRGYPATSHPFLVWSRCREIANILKNHGITAEPIDVLTAAFTTMRTMGQSVPADDRKLPNADFSYFANAYEILRSAGRSHENTIEVLAECKLRDYVHDLDQTESLRFLERIRNRDSRPPK